MIVMLIVPIQFAEEIVCSLKISPLFEVGKKRKHTLPVKVVLTSPPRFAPK
jgi:hypothetical protein